MSLRIDGEWIDKQDGAQLTEFESVKGGISSAFKRVASSGFRIERYLYGVRNQWFPIIPKEKGYDFAMIPTIELKNIETIPSKKETPLKEDTSTTSKIRGKIQA